MKRKICLLLLTASLRAVFALPALALEYTVDAPSQGQFAAPTSDNTIYVDELHQVNVDLSKNSAFVPPAFGSPEAYIPNRSQLLTPDLAGVAVSGGAVGSLIYPISPSPIVSKPQPAYTYVTDDLYYRAGNLGTLEIDEIDLSVKVYQGTDNATMKKGAGHFTNTSIWNGNVALAAHNRGVNDYFGDIHKLAIGDEIEFTTRLGTRAYEVYSVAKISNTDTSVLASTSDNIITLITCVRDQADYRWCVQAKEQD